ncbi:hypothetical protein ACFFHH_05000 [Cytobacillus solani]|uniref:hypothetical protein n=1 Tax=Cytobacillus solani TaxID=1637975 RepID=UPI0006AB7F67|nr:hypothetical protein [Cytobacillus solani]USK55617.1 hypothetical protein LIS82_03520 [Cytobacillus solani]
MTPFNEQLLKIEVISEEGIKEIKEQLNIQYQTLSSKEKASILAKTIHRMIDQSLPNFSKETKRRIRMELMNKKLSANSLSISANDIIESSIGLATREEIEQELPKWVYKKVDKDINVSELNIAGFLNSYPKREITYPISIDENEPISITNTFKSGIWPKYRSLFLGATAIIFIAFVMIIFVENPAQVPLDYAKGQTAENKEAATNQRIPNNLPSYLQYEQVDDKKLREWLNGRKSILAEEPYYSSIINAASEFNIDPLLLFAITGQEQGFVSREHVNAEKIANNPFNVFHSWEDFNTNISESSRIAARTIVNVSKDRPKEEDPFQWINRKYAEDPNWWIGVSTIYKQLEEVAQ